MRQNSGPGEPEFWRMPLRKCRRAPSGLAILLLKWFCWLILPEKEKAVVHFLQGLVTVVGRVLLTGIFLMSALGNKIPHFSQVAELMKSEGIPAPRLLLVGAIVFLTAGSLSILLGFKARIGALLLLVFLVLATYYFHDFWTQPAEAMWVLSTNESVKVPVQQMEMGQFMKNLALMGAMLILIANGPGAWSLDGRQARPGAHSQQQQQ
jgi:putative oxidoreductase